jgi:hypothetical protein
MEASLYFRKPAELDAFLELGAKVKQILENDRTSRTRGASRLPTEID